MQQEGKQLVRLSSQSHLEPTDNNLEALEQGLAAQSMASAEYLKAIQNKAEWLDDPLQHTAAAPPKPATPHEPLAAVELPSSQVCALLAACS